MGSRKVLVAVAEDGQGLGRVNAERLVGVAGPGRPHKGNENQVAGHGKQD